MKRSKIRLAALVAVFAAPMVVLGSAAQPGRAPLLQRFLARADGPPVEYRALRHLEANNPHFNRHAWMDAWTPARQRL